MKWFKTHNTCPLCRLELKDDSKEKVNVNTANNNNNNNNGNE